MEGVFQFESGGMRNVIMQLKPESIEDLIAVVSLTVPVPCSPFPAISNVVITRPWCGISIPCSRIFWKSLTVALFTRSRSCRFSACWQAIRLAAQISCAVP